jgi:hypothetical protein
LISSGGEVRLLIEIKTAKFYHGHPVRSIKLFRSSLVLNNHRNFDIFFDSRRGSGLGKKTPASPEATIMPQSKGGQNADEHPRLVDGVEKKRAAG